MAVNEQPGSNAEATENEAQKARKVKPSKPLPTDRLAFAKQIDVLRAYAALARSSPGKSISNQEVASITKLNPNTVSLANGFFAEVGLLQRSDGGHIPAPDVLAYGNAHEWDTPNPTHKLGPIIRETWFAKALVPRLSFRPLTEGECIAALAEEAGATTEYRGQLKTLIDYMEIANVVQREGDQIRLVRSSATPASPGPATTQAVTGAGAATAPAATASVTGEVPRVFGGRAAAGIKLDVNVDVDMREMAGWSADRISAFFNGIAMVVAAKAGLHEPQQLKDENS